MSRTLVVLRHGKSDWGVPADDRERPLTGRGRRQAAEAGAWLTASGLALDLAVVSPARRAGETWECAAVPGLALRVDEDAYTFDGADLLALVRRLDAPHGAVLVGHNPAVEELLERLTGEWVAMPTATLAVVDLADWSRAGDGAAALVAHGRPPA